MAFTFQAQYEPVIAQDLRAFYETLSEKDRRRFVAMEAKRLGHGGITYVATVFECSERTIERGMVELVELPHDPAAGRVRRPGGGRNKKIENDPQLEENLCSVLQVRTAGDPDDEDILWTDLSPRQISAQLDELGTPVSPTTVDNFLDEIGLSRRKIEKSLPGGESPDRNTQFERIYELQMEYLDAGNPLFSIDTKAKEHLGQLYREGRVRTQQPFQALDHDFPSWADGVIIPHGIFDPARNCGHINLGLSHDTAQFACDSFRHYWRRYAHRHYTDASSILWMCDCGGSNSASQHLFKQDLQHLVNDIGIEIRVAHYPSYCSKYNPIERKFFPHVGRACQGLLFDTVETVVQLMRRASTTQGLQTTVSVIRRAYEIGRKVARDFKSTMTILFDDLLPKWNYRAVPQ